MLNISKDEKRYSEIELDLHRKLAYEKGRASIIEEFEKLKAEIKEFCKGYLCTPQPEAIADDINEHIINKRISELKGE